MSLLELIWWVSLLFAGAALVVMTALVLLRMIAARREERRAERRRALTRQVLADGAPSVETMKRLPKDLLADTFVELIRLVRGDERAAFIAQASELGVLQHLTRQLRHGSARQRLLAAQALGQFDDETSTAQLQRALADRKPEVRLAAALSLAEAGNCDNIDNLVRELGLGSREDSTLTVTLFRILSADRMDEVKTLVGAAETPSSVRLAAIEALSESSDYSLVPVIAQLALNASDDAVELPHYLRALGKLAHPAARPAILDGLGRSTFAVRAAAAGAAGRIGLVDLAGRLATLLDDNEWWVRFRSAEALLRLGEPGVELLRMQARDGSPRARSTAAAMLAEHQLAP